MERLKGRDRPRLETGFQRTARFERGMGGQVSFGYPATDTDLQARALGCHAG